MPNFFLGITAVDDESSQPKHIRVLDLACDLLLQNVVIHRGKRLVWLQLHRIRSYVFVMMTSSSCFFIVASVVR
jgi:hypothetical protein